jgi:hypothetical protein
MPAIDPGKILVIPIKKKHAPRVMKLIQSLSVVSLKGGGKVPISLIIEIAEWHKKPVGARIKQRRGDLLLQSKKEQLQGTFMNNGKALREAIDKVPMMQPEIIIGKRIDGFFQIVKNQLVLSRIRGVSVHNTVGDNVLSFTYKVHKIVLTPKTVSVI